MGRTLPNTNQACREMPAGTEAARASRVRSPVEGKGVGADTCAPEGDWPLDRQGPRRRRACPGHPRRGVSGRVWVQTLGDPPWRAGADLVQISEVGGRHPVAPMACGCPLPGLASAPLPVLIADRKWARDQGCGMSAAAPSRVSSGRRCRREALGSRRRTRRSSAARPATGRGGAGSPCPGMVPTSLLRSVPAALALPLSA
jgi:hypothetical protein